MHELRNRPGSPRPIETLSPLQVLPQVSASVPVRLLVGSNDDITLPSLSKAYDAAGKSLGKNTDVSILPGVGHDGALTEPAVFDEVAKLIAQ
jgi:pimeloyl-ACP methyl ester carboxylesterase